jgi:hypothetical protein
MQGGMPPAPPPNVIPRPPAESKPIKIGSKGVRVAPSPPVVNPNIQMKPPTNIDDLLKNIRQTTMPPAGNGPPPPEKMTKRSKPGSTGKNSVVIKL